MSNIETILHVEIDDELGKLSDMEVGSDQHKAALDGVVKLLDRAIEMEKLSIENENQKMKLKQMEDEKKDRLRKDILTGAQIGVPAGIAVWAILKSLKFEETGTVTTTVGRSVFGKILPRLWS